MFETLVASHIAYSPSSRLVFPSSSSTPVHMFRAVPKQLATGPKNRGKGIEELQAVQRLCQIIIFK
jgi:hypothetical protein